MYPFANHSAQRSPLGAENLRFEFMALDPGPTPWIAWCAPKGAQSVFHPTICSLDLGELYGNCKKIGHKNQGPRKESRSQKAGSKESSSEESPPPRRNRPLKSRLLKK
jgi:hypothetical protein